MLSSRPRLTLTREACAAFVVPVRRRVLVEKRADEGRVLSYSMSTEEQGVSIHRKRDVCWAADSRVRQEQRR